MDLRLVELGVGEDAVDGLQGRAEEILAELLETSTGDRGVEVDALEERVDLNAGLGAAGQGALGALASSAQAAQGTSVGREIYASLVFFSFARKMTNETKTKDE
jgi:hypothetical protein